VKPRIAFVIDELEVGGTQRQLLAMAAGLLARGWTVRVVCLRPVLAMVPEFTARGVAVTVIEKHARLDLRLLAALCRFLRAERIEVVHAFSATAEFFAGLAARLVGCPFVASIRNLREELPLLPALGKRLACRLAHAVVANSEAGARHAVRTRVAPRGKVRVIANAVAPDRRAGRPREDVRRELGVPPGACVIAMVGRLVSQKGYDHAVAVAARVLAAHPHVRVLIAGDGPLRGGIHADIERHGVAAGVRLLGERSDVPDLLGAADIYLSTSRYEGQSNAVMEAMAAGLPVAASAVGGTPELVQDGVTGLLFAADDTPAAVDRLSRLVTDARLRRALGARARQHADARYGVDAMLAPLAALYERAVASA
jgi:glycosyltransferase involved in cell wall biosynthesis